MPFVIGAGIGGLTATAVLDVLHRQKKYRFPGQDSKIEPFYSCYAYTLIYELAVLL
jgi:hypothetical protein